MALLVTLAYRSLLVGVVVLLHCGHYYHYYELHTRPRKGNSISIREDEIAAESMGIHTRARLPHSL